jgi:Fur family zinc uptake transcriptional regulator
MYQYANDAVTVWSRWSSEMSQPSADAFPEPGHDHGSCESALLRRAGHLFEAKGLRMTDLRRRVLEEIAASHQALGAYEILDRMAAKGPRLAPISVYRAIEALHEIGIVHRLESRNAFFACHAGHEPARDQLILVCERCGRVAELEGGPVFEALETALAGASFKPRRIVTEVAGICIACQRSS